LTNPRKAKSRGIKCGERSIELDLKKKTKEFYEHAELNREELCVYSLICFTEKAKCSLKTKQIKVLIN